MSNAPFLSVLCPSCGRKFRWDERFARKRIRCKCTARFFMPAGMTGGAGAVTGVLSVPPVAGGLGVPAVGGLALPPPEEDLPVLEEEPAAVAEADRAITPTPADTSPEEAETAQEAHFDLNAAAHDEEAPPEEAETALESRPTGGEAPAEAVAADDAYEVALPIAEPAAAPASPLRPVLPNLARVSAVPLSPVERALKERADEHVPSVLFERVVPWVMIAVGIAFTLSVSAYYLGETHLRGLAGGAILLGLEVLVFLPVTLGGAAFTGRVMEVSFGPVLPMILKLAAVALLPAAVGDLANLRMFHAEFDIWFVPVSLVLYVLLTGPPLALMFKLSLYETCLTVLPFAIVRPVTVVILLNLLPKLLQIKSLA